MSATNLSVTNPSVQSPLRVSRQDFDTTAEEWRAAVPVAIVPPLETRPAVIVDRSRLVYESPGLDEVHIDVANPSTFHTLRVYTQARKGSKLGDLETVGFLHPARNGSAPQSINVPISAGLRVIVEQLPV